MLTNTRFQREASEFPSVRDPEVFDNRFAASAGRNDSYDLDPDVMWLRANAENNNLPKPVDAFKRVDASAVDARDLFNALDDVGLKLDPTTKTIKITEGEGTSISRVLNLLKEKKDIQVSFRTNPIYADYNRGYSLITIGGRQKLVLNHKVLADPSSVYKNLKEDVLRQIDPIAYNRAFRSGENLAEPSAEFTKLTDNIRTQKRITTDLYGNRIAKEGLPVELTSKIHGYEMADGIADDYLNKIILNTRTLEDSDGSVRTLLHERSHISKSDKELLSARSMTFNLDPETSLIHPAYRNFMRSDEVESRIVELAKFRRNNWDPKTRKYNSAELSTDEYVVLDETYRMIAEQRAFMSEISDGLRTGKIKPVVNKKNGWIELYHPDPYQGVQVLKWKRGEKIDDYLEYSLKNTNERIRQLDQAENHLAKNYDARRFNSEISPLEHVRRRYAAAKEKLLQKAESRALVSSDFQVKRNQSLSRRAKPMSASRSPAVAEDITHGKTVYERPALLERVSSYNKHDAEVVANLEDFENLMRKADDLTIREFREGIKNLDEGQVLGALSHSPEKLLEVSNVNVRPLTKVEKENFFKSQGFNDQFASTFAEKDEFIGRGIDDLLVPEGKIFDNASNSRLRNSTDEISKDELIPAEEMARYPDKLDQEKFSDILRGKGSDNDHNATTLVSDGLYRSPPSGLIKLEDTIPFTTKDKQKIRLISDKHFEELPEGTVLVDFDGKEVIKGSDSFDMETRGGFLPYGFTETRLSSVDDLAAIEAQMKAKLKDLSVKTENTAQDARSLKDLQWKKAREASEQSSEGFKRERGSRSLERYASDEGYQKIEHIDFEGMQIVPGTSSNVGMEVVVRFTPSATKTPVELKGVVTKDYIAGFDMVDKNGTPHMINVNFGNIESAYVRRAKGKPVVSQSDTSAWPTQMKFKDETVNAYERRLAEAKHKENSLREVLVNGKPLLKFSSNKEKEVFYNASSKIRAQDIQVESSVDKAVLKNIEINRELGRKPQFIDVNGYPVYAPGKSQFRAMVVKPGNDSIARGILDELGWQSGKSRGVKIAPELVGKTDNGATRLSDASKFEDSVVEFVGPQSTVYGSFPFPKDSRVVGISSSTDVVAVSARTAGDAPSGSYIMLTEIVPRNRKLVNSDQLFKERGLNSKYPTKYRDGGLEHAVEGVELDEIVNVIFIPMDPIKSAGYASLKKIKYLDDDSAKLFLQSKFGADAVRSEGDELLSIFGRGDVAGIERRRLDVVGASGKSDFVIRATDPAIASKLNREILRSGAKGDFSKLSDEAIDALAGMENLPKYEGLSFRTEALHRLNIDADGFITTKSFFRSSASPSTGILPSKFSNSKMPNVAMVIRGKSGRKIDPRLSYQPRSQEVMYPPGTKFKVVAKSVGGHGDTVLFLDEVAESALPKMAASRIQNSNAVKRGLASLESPKQKIYTAEVKKERIQKRNAKFSEITDADSSEFVQVAKRANSGDVGEAKIFADFENAVLKELNDKVVKNKDLVTAMTNVHKEVVWQAILRDDVLRKTVIGKYSDFKSLRFSFSKSGKDIERRLQTVLTESNRRFGDYVESLAKEGKWDELGSTLSSNQKNWFHAGFGASPDQAGLAARFSRTSLGKNGLATARSYGEARKGLENASKFVQGRVDSYGKKYRSIDGMVATTERGNRTLSAELIETVKKASPINGEDSLSAIQRTINQRFATNLSKKETKSIIDTIDTADRFSPGILAEARVNTDLSLRNNGILSADFKGQNAKNLEQVIAALVDSKGKGLDDQIRAVRKGEEIATESLDAKKDAFRRTVKEMFPDDKDIDAHIFFSGDDGIYLPPRVLTKADEEKFLQTWLKNGKADDLRQTFVDTHYVDTGRLIPAQSRSDLVVQAEAMEKNLRKELIERMPRNELNETQIAVKFSTNEKGGKAKMSIYLARDGENLSPLVVKEIENSIRAKGYEPGSITQVMSDRYRIAKAAEAENALTYAERPGGVLDKIIDIDPVNARLGLNKGRLDIVPHKNDIDSAIKSRMVARTNNLPVVAGPGRGLASISEVGKKSSRPLDGEIIAPPKKPKLSGPAFDHSSAVDAEFEEVGRSRSRALVPYKPKSKLNKKVILGGAAAVAAGAVGVSQLKNGGNGNESTPLDQSEVAPYDYSVDDSNFVPTENVSYKRNDTQPEELINPLISGGRVPVEETRVEYRPRSETAGIFSGDPQYSGDPQVQGDPNNSGLNSLEEGPSGPGPSSTGSIGAPFIPLAALAAAGAGAAYLIKKNKDKKKFDRELASLNPDPENPDELSAEEKEIKELRSKIDGLEAEAWYKIEKESSDAVIVSASRDLVDQVMELMRGKGLEVERKFSEITTYEKMRLPPHYSLTIKNIPEKYKPFFGKYFQTNEYNPIPKKFEAQRLGFLQSANISIIAKANRNHFMLTQVA
ncbi:MAG: hypothetical protein M9962_09250 [Oligoflexia bacterium]|nr:hypothetical protein [Oligoflexia bacterium]